MRCDEVMTQEVERLATADTVREAARRMLALDVGFLPVCQSDGQPVGTVTDRDIVLRAVAEGRAGSTRIEEIMSPDVVACRPEDSVEEAERLMRARQVSRLLVVGEDGRIAGVISLADLTQADTEYNAGRTLADLKEPQPMAT